MLNFIKNTPIASRLALATVSILSIIAYVTIMIHGGIEKDFVSIFISVTLFIASILMLGFPLIKETNYDGLIRVIGTILLTWAILFSEAIKLYARSDVMSATILGIIFSFIMFLIINIAFRNIIRKL
jgi:hypothetical protein